MKSKFEFYEIVKIKTHKHKNEDNGRIGYIRGKAEPESENMQFCYAIKFSDYECLKSFPESELESTGKFFDKSKIPNHGSIRVVVDKDGAGSVKPSYESYAEIESAIKDIGSPKASGYLIEAGMVGEDLNAMYKIIELATKSQDSIIRGSGYTALWHIFRRFNDSISIDFLVTSMQRGLTDTDKYVASVVACIMEDLEFKMPIIWNKLNK